MSWGLGNHLVWPDHTSRLNAGVAGQEDKGGKAGYSVSQATVYLALGSNLGDRRANLVRALDALHNPPTVSVTAVSPIYETVPVGGPQGQPLYLNAAIRVKTTLTPEQLLQRTQQVEHQLGRRRTIRNAPRPIDIDILLIGDLIRDSPDPVIPHPRMHQRGFVLRPLADIAPEVVHPTSGSAVINLLAALPAGEGAAPVHNDAWWAVPAGNHGCHTGCLR